ncbi:hypothetical protein GCM10023223_35750 [Stackebrandtia albiflava]
MNSGLYAFAGDSATATAAACANRFDEPITKVSKLYFGFNRLACATGGVACRGSLRNTPVRSGAGSAAGGGGTIGAAERGAGGVARGPGPSTEVSNNGGGNPADRDDDRDASCRAGGAGGAGSGSG